jgi:hypothetical protein
MNSKQVARKRRRLPGEIAFDRCFLPLVALSLLNITLSIIEWRSSPSEPYTEEQLAAQMPPPLWHAWLWFTLGLLLAVLWFRAVVTLARAWRDPSSRVLRFSASVLLIPFAVATCRLLLTPLQ